VTELELLRPMESRGYPTDYLLARIKGRRLELISDWRSLTAADPLEALRSSRYAGVSGGAPEAAVWLKFLTELDWLYRQMDERVRDSFAPVFFWFELRTLLISLRFLRGGDGPKVTELLATSLLAERVKRVLKGGEKAAPVVDALISRLKAVAERCWRLRGIYRDVGAREFEEQLLAIYLERVAGEAPHLLIREFFRALIDMRNLLILYKQLRWNIGKPAAFVKGGDIGRSKLRNIAERRDLAEVTQLILSLPGMGEPPASRENVEHLLLGWLTRRVRRWGREPAGVGPILDYLWRCYLEALNLGLLIHGRGMETELLAAEVVA
jgi:hypothetical protein